MEWDDVCADLIIHHFMAALCHRLNAGRAEQRAGLNPLRGIINCVAELDERSRNDRKEEGREVRD